MSLENKRAECEDCGYKPLKYFERCPKCNSEAYHKSESVPKIKNDEEKI